MLKHTKEYIETQKKIEEFINENLVDWYRIKKIPDCIKVLCATEKCKSDWPAKYSLKHETITKWYCYECINRIIENICEK